MGEHDVAHVLAPETEALDLAGGGLLGVEERPHGQTEGAHPARGLGDVPQAVPGVDEDQAPPVRLDQQHMAHEGGARRAHGAAVQVMHLHGASFLRTISAPGGPGPPSGCGRGRVGLPAGHLQHPAQTAQGEQPVPWIAHVQPADELLEHRQGVVVDALAEQVLVLVEQEVGGHPDTEPVAGRRDRAEGAEVGAHQPELDDHRVLAVPQGDELVVLVREGGPGEVVVAADRPLPVVDRHQRHEFVARMRERGQDVVPLLAALVVDVVEDQLLPGRAHFVGDHRVWLRPGRTGGCQLPVHRPWLANESSTGTLCGASRAVNHGKAGRPLARRREFPLRGSRDRRRRNTAAAPRGPGATRRASEPEWVA